MVSLDFGSLRGRVESDRGMRYTLDLVGPVDGRWLRSFRSLQESVESYACYRLEGDGHGVSIHTPAGNDPEQVIVLIERLVEFVRIVDEGRAAER